MRSLAHYPTDQHRFLVATHPLLCEGGVWRRYDRPEPTGSGRALEDLSYTWTITLGIQSSIHFLCAVSR